jgi:septal ring factor EnvC (AmiA/AmiB activator)
MPDQTSEPLSDYHATTQRFAGLLVAITTALGERGDTLFGDLPRLVAEQHARVKELEAQLDEARRDVGAARGTAGALQARVVELREQVAAQDSRIAELEGEKDLQESYDQWLKHEFGVDEGAYARFLEEEVNNHG